MKEQIDISQKAYVLCCFVSRITLKTTQQIYTKLGWRMCLGSEYTPITFCCVERAFFSKNVAGVYESVQFDGDPNKDQDLADLNQFYVILH